MDIGNRPNLASLQVFGHRKFVLKTDQYLRSVAQLSELSQVWDGLIPISAFP